jgi:hypothetical protein
MTNFGQSSRWLSSLVMLNVILSLYAVFSPGGSPDIPLIEVPD